MCKKYYLYTRHQYLIYQRRIMNINLEYYRIFYYVAKYQNFTRAARALGNGQPNITRAINLLEQEIRCTLFIRTNRGVRLTPEGERLYVRVAAAMEQLQLAEEELQASSGLEHGSISIGASETALNVYLLEKLKNFLEDMQWEGFANMDIKYDARTGEYKMFEMNPRQGRSSYFVTAAGYNLSKWLVEDVLEHKELGLTIADTKSLWMIAPYGVIKKYLKDPDLLARADKLKKEGKCAHQLFCKEDWNLKRWLWYIRSQLNYYRKTARYYGNKGLRD